MRYTTLLLLISLAQTSCQTAQNKAERARDRAEAVTNEALDEARALKKRGNQAATELKEEAKATLRKTRQQLADILVEAFDRVAPTYDAHQADTQFNKQRFEEMFQRPISPDVSNLYCYHDGVGFDHSFYFAFRCNEVTAKAIIEEREMTVLADENYLRGFFDLDFPWWPSEAQLDGLPLYVWEDGHIFEYFWYDEEQNQAYFHSFNI